MPIRKEKHLSGRKSTKKEIEARKKRRLRELMPKRLKPKPDKPKKKNSRSAGATT
jgi:hypothetical protein